MGILSLFSAKPKIVPAVENTSVKTADLPWMKVARSYIGLKEIPGPKHNTKIIEWLEKLKLPFRDDETSWCGTFVGGILIEAGRGQYVTKNPAGARNWLNTGTVIDKPAVGAIVIFWRGSKSGWQGHVGFVAGVDQKGNLMVLGGNQGDAVNIKPFGKDRVLGYRWPGPAPLAERYNLPVLSSDGKLSQNEA